MSKNRYQNESLIGTSETGAVYEALDTKLNRQVALRRFFDKSNIGEVPEGREEFNVAAQPLLELQHSNLLNVFTVRVDDKGAFVASQLLAGKSLHEEVAKGAMTPYDVAELAKQQLDAFSFIHDKGYYHGALTAGSIMMTPRARGGHRAVLIDLGLDKLAALIKGEDGSLSVGVNHAILAPELFDGAEADERSDLYMLGQLFYMCLAGAHPYEGLEVDEVKQQHEAGLPSVKQYNPAVSEELANWLMKLTNVDPADRTESAVEALNAMPEIQPTAEALSARVRQYTDKTEQLQAQALAPKSVTSANPIRLNVGITPAQPETAPVPIMAPGTKDETSRIATTIPLVSQQVAGAQPQPQQVPPQHETSPQMVLHPEKKKSPVGLFIGLGSLVVIAAVVGFMMITGNDHDDDHSGEDMTFGADMPMNGGTDSEIVEPIDNDDSNDMPEVITYFDGSSREHQGWMKSVPDNQKLDPAQDSWFLSNISKEGLTGIKYPIEEKLEKMFNRGWRITYRVKPNSGPHQVGFFVSGDSNPGWGEGGVGVALVIRADRTRMVFSLPNGKDYVENKEKRHEIRIRKGKKNFVDVVIQQEAQSTSGEYVVKINGKEVFRDVFLKNPKRENPSYWDNYLFSSNLTKVWKASWLVKKINLETL